MFTYKTFIKESSIHGMGVFADEFIPSGSIIWKYIANFDVKLTQEEFDELPEIAKVFVLNFCYFNEKEGGYVLCMDNAKYTNHSEDPNMEPFDEISSIAIKDIHQGEEITENYYKFDKLASEKLNS